MLINTSFNTKGRPIVNLAAEALEILCAEAALDFVALEDAGGTFWLFAADGPDGPGCGSL